MDCLKCSNFWKNDIDETKCNQCGCETTPKESEEKENG